MTVSIKLGSYGSTYRLSAVISSRDLSSCDVDMFGALE